MISRNATYLCFMQQVRERNSIRNLSQQIFCSRVLSEAFESVCESEEPHEYLVLDLNPSTDQKLRIRQTFDVRKPLFTFQQQ